MNLRRVLIALGILGLIDVASGVALQSEFGAISLAILFLLRILLGNNIAASIAGMLNMILDFGLFYLLIAWWMSRRLKAAAYK